MAKTETRIEYKSEGVDYTEVALTIRLTKQLSLEDYKTITKVLGDIRGIANKYLTPKVVK